MANEDFSTWTETDPATYISYSGGSNEQVNFLNMRCDIAAHFSKDFGAAHFGDFEHLASTEYVSAGEGSSIGYGGYYIVGDTQGSHSAQTNALGIRWHGYTTPANTRLYCFDQDSSNTDYSGWNDGLRPDTQYWLTISRSTTTFQVLIYDDSGRESLLDTISVVCTDTTLQWMMMAASWDAAIDVDRHVSGYWKDLDLQEVGGGNAPTGVLSGALVGSLGGPV